MIRSAMSDQLKLQIPACGHVVGLFRSQEDVKCSSSLVALIRAARDMVIEYHNRSLLAGSEKTT